MWVGFLNRTQRMPLNLISFLCPGLGCFAGSRGVSMLTHDADDVQKWSEAPPRRLFHLKGSSVLAISQGDLAQWEGDAIVNAASEQMLGGPGVHDTVHRAAGPQLSEACKSLAEGVRCPTGEARITDGFRLKAKHVIHVVGPFYEAREKSEPLLRDAIKNSLLLCKDSRLKSVALPAVSCGSFGYPADEAAEASITAILEFSEGIDLIEFVLSDRETYVSFVAAASKNLQDHSLAHGEGDATGHEMSEVTKEGVLSHSAEDAVSCKSPDNRKSEHESTDTQSRPGSNRREQDAIRSTCTKSKGPVSTSYRAGVGGGARESGESKPDETGGAAPSGVIVEGKGVPDDPMSQEQDDDTLETGGAAPSGVILEGKGVPDDPMSQEQDDDMLDTSAGATRGGVQAENLERMGASAIGVGRQKGEIADKEAPYRKRTMVEGSRMPSGGVNTGATTAAGSDQVKRGGAASGINQERDGRPRRVQKRAGPPPRRTFQLGGSSVLALSGGDLTKWEGDAIVNAANELMLGGAGVDGAIHRAAGPQLVEACWNVEEVARGVRCPTGEARITEGFRLKAKYVIHTVGPVYHCRERSEPLLRNAIKNSLLLCKEYGLKSIAFPAISCGVYGYPADKAAEVAIATILEFSEGIDLVEFVLFGQDTYGPFMAAAAMNLPEDRLAYGQDSASGNEMSKLKRNGVLPNNAEDANDEDLRRNARESEKSQADEKEGAAPSGIILGGQGVADDPMSQEQDDNALKKGADATRSGIQARNKEVVGASDDISTGAPDGLSEGLDVAAGNDVIKRGGTVSGISQERDGPPCSVQKREGPPHRRIFHLEGSSVLALSRGDLTKWEGDAIVNGATELLLGGEGVDGAIHNAAGPELVKACWEFEEDAKGVRCPAGEARITKGFLLKAKHVIHAVGPTYKSREVSEPLLRNAIKNALLLCKEYGLKRVAFPAISCGIFGYPTDKAAEVAIATILEFSEGIDLVEFVLVDQDTYGSFTAAASKQLQEHRVADGEDDASDNEMSETKTEDVLPNSAGVASSFMRSDNDNSEQKNTDSRQASESNRRD